MITGFKRIFYFPFATYFRIFANIRLSRWQPKIVVITGSYGKTTLLELIKSGLESKAKYSDHANSAFGVPFDILDLSRKTLKSTEWFGLFLNAPLNAFKKPPNEKIYVVEADCDRPGEGKFLATLLSPNITLWLSSEVAHGENYEYVLGDKFQSVEDAIAYEYGYFIEYTKDLAIINGDNTLIKKEATRSKARIREVRLKDLATYKIEKLKTEFIINGNKFIFQELLPREVFYSIAMANSLFEELGENSKKSFASFKQPPGRSSVFRGIKNTTLIDSSYNATPESFNAILSMYKQYPGKIKWGVFGDIIELGQETEDAHKKIADQIIELNLEKIILVGPRLRKNAYPKLIDKIGTEKTVSFESPSEALGFIKGNLKGEETILFKGARFLEGIIEDLLADKKDIEKLVRREKVWDERRAKWGV